MNGAYRFQCITFLNFLDAFREINKNNVWASVHIFVLEAHKLDSFTYYSRPTKLSRLTSLPSVEYADSEAAS